MEMLCELCTLTTSLVITEANQLETIENIRKSLFKISSTGGSINQTNAERDHRRCGVELEKSPDSISGRRKEIDAPIRQVSS